MSNDIDASLLTRITPQARAWACYVAKDVKTQTADNHDQIFIIGRTLLDKEGFNKINNEGFDVVHGVQVIYGPFNTLARAHEFVAEYKLEWPGDNDWRYISPGRPEILSSYFDPGRSEIVHNASLEFQGQLGYNEVQRRIKEMEEVQERLRQREEKAVSGVKPLSKEELEQHISWQQKQVEAIKKQLEQMKKHLNNLKTLSS